MINKSEHPAKSDDFPADETESPMAKAMREIEAAEKEEALRREQEVKGWHEAAKEALEEAREEERKLSPEEEKDVQKRVDNLLKNLGLKSSRRKKK